MKEDIEVKQKNIEDYIQKKKTYHCPKCLVNLTYPHSQTKGLECPFCHGEIVVGKYSDGEEDENEFSRPKPKYLLIERDANGKIKKIEQVDKEEYEKRTSKEDEKIQIRDSLKDNKYFKKINFSDYTFLNSIKDNGLYMVVYKDREICNITNIIEKMIKEADKKIKSEFDEFNFTYNIVIKDNNCYTDKKTLFFPQIFLFYKNESKEYVLEYMNLKEFNSDIIYNKLIYWKHIIESGTI